MGFAAAVLVGLVSVGGTPSVAAPQTVVPAASTPERSTNDPAPPPPEQSGVAKPRHSSVGPGSSRIDIEVKFRPGSGVRLRGGTLVVAAASSLPAGLASQGPPADASDIARVRAVISSRGASIERLMSSDEAVIDKAVGRVSPGTGTVQTDLNLWHHITLPAGTDIVSALDALNALDVVEIAYAAPLPSVLPASPDLRPRQGYHSPASLSGIDANYAWTIPGGTGSNVRVHDLEYSWNGTHEDLSKLRTSFYANGTPVDPFAASMGQHSRDHGTAVVGEIAGDSNGFGVTGLVPDTTMQITNVTSTAGYTPASAVAVATSVLRAGDVMLIEQQTTGPGGACGRDQVGCVALEWIPSVYDAIRNATTQGIIVVEAAGNGWQNLDSPIYGTSFPQGKADSGAIIVGAGGAPGCQNLNSPGARSRLDFSNYGRRVDLQAWGECVTTTGYGNAYDGGFNAWYTGSFGGTSSASPIVASAAASLSSIAKARGFVLSPRDIRTRLRTTGTPQTAGLAGSIGPLPNLRAAIAGLGVAVDTTPPAVGAVKYYSTPGSQLGSTVNVTGAWTATDASGIAAYAVYVRTNGGAWSPQTLAAATSTWKSWLLTPGSRYEIAVAAKDTRGNWSAYRYSPAFKATVFQENSGYIGYSTGWVRAAYASGSGGYVTVSGQAGANAQFTFTGSGVAWIATKATNRGYAHVYLDGVYKGAVNLNSATTVPRTAVVSYYWPTVGVHSIKLVVVGTATNPKVDVDAFVKLG
ncbi:MAG: S8 family serine peptidase [Terracoccus sp.]